MKPITSPNNPRLKRALRLHDSRGRKKQGRIIIFGLAEIARAIKSNVQIDEAYFLEGEHGDQQLDLWSSSTEKFVLPKTLFRKLSFGQRDECVVAIAQRPATNLEKISPDHTLILILEAIEKPGNIGAVFRSAVAGGVQAVVLADPICDVFHPNAIRSSLGSVFSIEVACSESEACQRWLLKNDFQIVTTRVESDCEYTQADLKKKSAIVLGNEANGISEHWVSENYLPVTIPMNRDIDSLNIAMSSTLMVYEARRQRQEISLKTES